MLKYVDPVPDLLVMILRGLLGCAAGLVAHDQFTGIYAAGAVGASAPAIFAALSKGLVIPESLGIRLELPTGAPAEAALAPSPDGQEKAAE